jgi:hypothetical protein
MDIIYCEVEDELQLRRVEQLTYFYNPFKWNLLSQKS